MNSPDGGWTLLDHTADIRMEFRGATLAELFRNAALGLMEILISGAALSPRQEITVSLREDTTEELLVGWLREILYQYHTSGLCVARLEISEASANEVEAKLFYGAPAENYQPEIEIKGVTYHGLSVQIHEWGYSARVVFDI